MVLNFLDGLETKELIFSNEPVDKLLPKKRKILDFDKKAFLVFIETDFSNFIEFKFFFKKFGSLYLLGLLKYIYKKLFIYDKDYSESEYIENILLWNSLNSKNEERILKDYLKAKINIIEESYIKNNRDNFTAIYDSLVKSIEQFEDKNIPIEVSKLEDLFNFLYLSKEQYFDFEIGLFEKKSLILKELQDEISEYIKIYKGEKNDHIIYNKYTLTSYLRSIMISADLDKDEIIFFEINPKDLDVILVLELLYYIISKKRIGECANCGKFFIVKTNQLRFLEADYPIYCCDYCQEDAKNKRGNERKKLLRKILKG